MRRSVIGLAVLVTLSTVAYVALAGGSKCGKPCGQASQSSAATAAGSCEPAKAAGSVACENLGGKTTGNFDPLMSGACRFACATRLKYDPKDVLAQPGAVAGKLTQCPVSGVVFTVESWRPRVRLGREEYVICCDKCATKLKKDPRHYLKA